MNKVKGVIHNEEQGVCIHCGEIGYQIHYHDGVCHRCWKLGKPGRSEVKHKTPKIIMWVLYALAFGIPITLACLIF